MITLGYIACESSVPYFYIVPAQKNIRKNCFFVWSIRKS
nr:MAG TPA: hypothetical protein [Caudoviricetes sp.]